MVGSSISVRGRILSCQSGGNKLTSFQRLLYLLHGLRHFLQELIEHSFMPLHHRKSKRAMTADTIEVKPLSQMSIPRQNSLSKTSCLDSVRCIIEGMNPPQCYDRTRLRRSPSVTIEIARILWSKSKTDSGILSTFQDRHLGYSGFRVE